MVGEQAMMVPLESQDLAAVTERMVARRVRVLWTGIDTAAGTTGVKEPVGAL